MKKRKTKKKFGDRSQAEGKRRKKRGDVPCEEGIEAPIQVFPDSSTPMLAYFPVVGGFKIDRPRTANASFRANERIAHFPQRIGKERLAWLINQNRSRRCSTSLPPHLQIEKYNQFHNNAYN
jgi:hypothetical protein